MLSGPYGKGFHVEDSGVSIAFAGGTGVLTFVDYVAKLAMKVLDQTKSSSRLNKT